MARPLARWSTRPHPTDRQSSASRAVPPCGSAAELQAWLPLPRAVPRELLPAGWRLLADLLHSRQALAQETGTANPLAAAVWRWLMEHGIHAACGDQGSLLPRGRPTSFQHTGGASAHELAGALSEPSAAQADHLLGPPAHGLLRLASPLTPLGGRGKARTNQARPSVACSGEVARHLPSRASASLDGQRTGFRWRAHEHANALLC